MKRTMLVLILAVSFFTARAQTQNNIWVKKFDDCYFQKNPNEKNYKAIYTRLSLSGDAYDFMQLTSGIDALNAMYKVTHNSLYMRECITLIDNVINNSKDLNELNIAKKNVQGKYLGWISKNPKRADTQGQDVVLFEGYFFRNVLEFLYTLKTTDFDDLSAADKQWYYNKLNFVEQNVWSKWLNRNPLKPYVNFIRSRTHMSSHWADMGLILQKLSANTVIKQQAQLVCQSFDKKLRNNIRPNPINKTGYIWNSTWDDESFIRSSVQDVNHGNHVVDYIITAIDLKDSNWNKGDALAICNTIKYVLYNSSTMDFYDTMDRSPIIGKKQSGTFQAWGWVKYGRFDEQVQQLYANWIQNADKKVLTRFTQSAQLYANMALNYQILHSTN